MFRHTDDVKEKFNIAFGLAVTDVCSTCLRLKKEIKVTRAKNMKLVKEKKNQIETNTPHSTDGIKLRRNDEQRKFAVP